MSDPTIIPTEARQELCQMALDGQAALLRAFDGIEAGDLGAAVVALTEATVKVRTINDNLVPLARLAIIRGGFGVPEARHG